MADQHSFISEPTIGATKQPIDGPKRRRNTHLSGIASTITVLLVAPLVAFLLTSFIFQSYQVDGPSMQTTLNNNDRLLVWKLPRTWARLTGNHYIPNRGDIVIFVERNDYADKQLIKRVIGLPGERVVVKDGLVMVFNEQYPNGFNPDKTLPYGIVIDNTSGIIDTIVPEGHIFVMGDNRDNSLDSRSAIVGAVHLNDIVGKLMVRVWPVGDTKIF